MLRSATEEKIDLTEASEKRYNDRKVVENIMINSIEKPIELSIEQKHTGKGNPNAVLTFGVELNNRQKDLLEKLSEFDSKKSCIKYKFSRIVALYWYNSFYTYLKVIAGKLQH